MQRFRCPACSAEVFEADLGCLACGVEIALDPVAASFFAGEEVTLCANRATIGCNWVRAAPERCRSCHTTAVVPPIDHEIARAGWADAERTKRRLILQLLQLGLLSREPSPSDPRFEMLWSEDGSVTIGHADGVITIDVGEAEDARRERLRHRLSETYRTMLGHLRHEIGHFYWPHLADDGGPDLERTRAVFGDDTADYGEAIDRHYAEGPPEEWAANYISEYATMHPWEDWAESFAHYLHLRDVLDTATRFAVTIGRPTLDGAPSAIEATTEAPVDFDALMRQWTSLTPAINALNRSMNQPDLYPFAPADAVVDKIRLVHELVSGARRR